MILVRRHQHPLCPPHPWASAPMQEPQPWRSNRTGGGTSRDLHTWSQVSGHPKYINWRQSGEKPKSVRPQKSKLTLFKFALVCGNLRSFCGNLHSFCGFPFSPIHRKSKKCSIFFPVNGSVPAASKLGTVHRDWWNQAFGITSAQVVTGLRPKCMSHSFSNMFHKCQMFE